MGQSTSNITYQQLTMGTSNVPPLVTLQGGDNYQTGWPQPEGTYAHGGNPNPSNIPFLEVLILCNKVAMLCFTTTSFRW